MNAAAQMKWLVSRGVSYTAIALLALALLSLNFAAEKLHRGIIEQHAVMEHAAANIKYEVSRFHLWFEEALATDDAITLEASFRYLDGSEQSAKAMLEGRTDQGKKVAQLTDPELRKEIGHALNKLAAMRVAAKQRLSMPGKTGVGTASDRDFDAVYNALLVHVEHVESVLKQEVANDLVGLHRFHVWMNIMILLLVAGVALVVFRSSRRQKEDAERILEGERRFRVFFEQAAFGVAQFEAATGRFITMNRRYCEILGYSKEELQQLDLRVISYPDDSCVDQAKMELLASGKINELTTEARYVRKDGSVIWVNLSISPMWRPGQHPSTYIVVAEDVTKRKQMEIALREEMTFSDSLLETAQVIILVLNPDGTVRYINPYMEGLSGFRLREVIGKDWFDTFLPKRDWSAVREVFRRAVDDIQTVGNINPIVAKDGGEYQIEWYDKTLKGRNGEVIGLLAIGLDVSERLQAEEKIRASLEEKEVLLREIHHRVKNNLQVVSSLLSLQAHAAGDAQADWLRDAQARIGTISLVHERLCHADDLAHIDFQVYIKREIQELSDNYGVNERGISIVLDLDKVLLDMDRAVPLGLVMGELVTNSIKHAYPAGSAGTITLTLQRLDDQGLELTVADDGIGLPEGLDWKNADGVGLQLVPALIGQLGGEIDLRPTAKGTCFVVTIKK